MVADNPHLKVPLLSTTQGMFNGSNELVLNESTMMAAVQHWLNDQVLTKPVLVKSIECEKSTYAKQFRISLEDINKP